MRSRTLLMAAIAFISITPSAQADPTAPCVAIPILDDACESWVSTGSHSNLEVGGPIAVSDDLVVSAATLYGEDGFGDWLVTARNTEGEILWGMQLDGGDGVHDFPYSLQISPEADRVFVTGILNNDWKHGELGVVALNAATGAEIWRQQHVGLLGGMTYGRSIAVTPDGAAIVVTGSGHNDEFTDASYETLALSSQDGSRLWDRAFHPGPASAYSVAIPATGDVAYVTGIAGVGYGGDYEIATIAHDLADGSHRWVSRFDGGRPIDGGQAVSVSPDASRVFVAGWSETGPRTNLRVRSAFTVLAIDAATGTQEWVSRTEGTSPGLTVAHSVSVSPDGSTLLVAGHQQGDVPELDFDLIVKAFDAATGEVRWSDRERIPGMLSEIVGLGPVADISPDGSRAYVVGSVRPVGPSNFGEDPSQAVTLAYELASGDRAWTARFNLTPGDASTTARVAVSDAVFVSGTASSPVAGVHAFVARYEL